MSVWKSKECSVEIVLLEFVYFEEISKYIVSVTVDVGKLPNHLHIVSILCLSVFLGGFGTTIGIRASVLCYPENLS